MFGFDYFDFKYIRLWFRFDYCTCWLRYIQYVVAMWWYYVYVFCVSTLIFCTLRQSISIDRFHKWIHSSLIWFAILEALVAGERVPVASRPIYAEIDTRLQNIAPSSKYKFAALYVTSRYPILYGRTVTKFRKYSWRLGDSDESRQFWLKHDAKSAVRNVVLPSAMLLNAYYRFLLYVVFCKRHTAQAKLTDTYHRRNVERQNKIDK